MTPTDGVPVHRAPMRSRLDDVDASAAVEHALATGVCGIGGRLPEPPADLTAAVAAVRDHHGERVAARLARFAAVPTGGFVWTRRGADLFLGRLAGPWRYDRTPGAHALDLTHVLSLIHI